MPLPQQLQIEPNWGLWFSGYTVKADAYHAQ